ncbi:hypothetical protein [Streptomyces sp. NPDC050507]|uniref:hypothetical protein n=1 Tax=Streptomyces sp. NPDC050507 TaxID=3365619 RepID=UPI0037951DDF
MTSTTDGNLFRTDAVYRAGQWVYAENDSERGLVIGVRRTAPPNAWNEFRVLFSDGIKCWYQEDELTPEGADQEATGTGPLSEAAASAYEAVADLWTSYLGTRVRPRDVAMMSALAGALAYEPGALVVDSATAVRHVRNARLLGAQNIR